MTGEQGGTRPNKPLTQIIPLSGYPSLVTTPERDPRTDLRAMLESLGFHITDDGIRQARERRLAAAARHTPERRAAWRRQVGMGELR